MAGENSALDVSGIGGRETSGLVISDKQGNLFSAISGNPIVDGQEVRPGPVLRSEREPAAKPAAPPSVEVDAEVNREDVATERAMLKAGMSAEEVAKIRGRPVEQIGQPSVQALTRQSIDAELSNLADMRRHDPKRYWSSAVQEREAALYDARTRLQSGKAEAAAVAPQDQASAPDIDPALISEWSRTGGVEHHLGVARATVSAMLDALEPGEADAFSASFDALPAGVQTSIYRQIALDGGGFSKSATDAQLSDFRALCPEAASLLQGWGRRAAQRLGAAHARLDAIEAGMSEADFARAEAWLRGRSPTQRTALMKALAGGVR
jgi:hypothetical protein